MRDIKHMSDIPHGFIVINDIIISLVISLFVQFDYKVSLYPLVIFVVKVSL